MVNEFSAGEFMETHYHSQFDNEEFYQEEVSAFTTNFMGNLCLPLTGRRLCLWILAGSLGLWLTA